MRTKGTKNKKYSPEFKISVILDMRENRLGQRETIRKYWLTKSRKEESLYVSTLKLWERIYLEEGTEGLMKERRGRATKADNPKVGRPPKLDKSVEEDLIAKCQRLEMENEYLKKLIALDQEEEEREKGRKRR